jgi:outer membrane receptor protein involved in Fe transport
MLQSRRNEPVAGGLRTVAAFVLCLLCVSVLGLNSARAIDPPTADAPGPVAGNDAGRAEDAPSGTVRRAESEGDTGLRLYILQDSIWVTAVKTPLRLRELASSATVVTASQLESRSARTLVEMLGALPGIHAYDFSGEQTQGAVESRGFTSFGRTSYLVVLLDDVPINDLETDKVDWSLLSFSQVERIELLRGPASFLYGNSSMAGLVNVVTRQPGPGFRGWGQVEGGSYGRLSHTLGLSHGGPRTQVTGSWRRQSQDGFRENSDGSISSGYGQLRAALGSSWSVHSRLLVDLMHQAVPGPLPDPQWKSDSRSVWSPPGSSPSSAQIHDERKEQFVQSSLELRGQPDARLEATASVRADFRDADATESIIPIGPLDRKTRSRSGGGELRLQWTPPIPLLRSLLTGAELGIGHTQSRYFDSSNPGVRLAAGKARRSEAALYSCARLVPRDRLTLSAGIRWDWMRSRLTPDNPADANAPAQSEFTSLSPALGLNYDLPSAGNVYVSAAGSFKAPTLEQLHDQRPYPFDPDGDGPAPVMMIRLSSPELKPQRGVHLEAGIRSNRRNWIGGELGTYYARSRDEIGFDLAHFRYDNIDESTHYGVEAQVRLAALEALPAEVSYTYTRARFDRGDYKGKQINGVPEHQIRMIFTYHHRYGGSLSLEAAHVRGQWLDEQNRYRIPSYSTLDGNVTQRLKRVWLFASVQNLLDETYAPAAYLTTIFGPQGQPQDLPLYFPASGRSLRAGLRVEVP